MAVSKQQWVYDALRQRIVAGVYGPGSQLVLATLARELDVSPLPVREAIRRLEAEGWLTYTRNVGATVSRADTDGVEQALQVLAAVEAYATALAAPHLHRKDVAAARRLNDRMRKQLDPLEFSRLNRQLHVALLEQCPNEHLRSLARNQLDRVDALLPSLLVAVAHCARDSVEEHDEILGLIDERAPAAEIETAVRKHELRLIEAHRRLFAEPVAARA